MTKHVVEFTMPEDQYDLETFMNGPKLEGLVHRVEQEIFRPARKHGYSNVEIQSIVSSLDRLVDTMHNEGILPDYVPKDENGLPIGASDLISRLEQLYYLIKDEELTP
jgi:hypothetical protein